MSEEKQRHDWNQSALICTILANANRDPKKKPFPFELSDFHPLLKKRERVANVRALFMKLDSLAGLGIIAGTVDENTPWAHKKSTLAVP